MTPPELSIDGREVELLDDDDTLSGSSVKSKLAWDDRDEEYVLVWWQSPFYVATENGGYSMTASLLDDIPENIETIWVVDERRNLVCRMERAWYEDPDVREAIGPNDDRFETVAPTLQYAVDIERATETHPMTDVLLP